MYNIDDKASIYYQHQRKLGSVISFFSYRLRKKMFDVLMALTRPTAKTIILDVGVTSDCRADCNFFERLYSYPDNIIAVGTETSPSFIKKHPRLKFFQADGTHLPFKDKSFDLVVSFATIEHVGCRKRQRSFVHELCRVGRQCCITTPNRWYPLEFHTIVPLLHWLPPQVFRSILKLMGKTFFAKEENLNLLSKKTLLNMIPLGRKAHLIRFRLFGFTSNLMLYFEDNARRKLWDDA